MHQFKEGDFVEDTWFDRWGVGKVVKVLKTRIKVYYPAWRLMVYDNAHCQFLRKVESIWDTTESNK